MREWEDWARRFTPGAAASREQRRLREKTARSANRGTENFKRAREQLRKTECAERDPQPAVPGTCGASMVSNRIPSRGAVVPAGAGDNGVLPQDAKGMYNTTTLQNSKRPPPLGTSRAAAVNTYPGGSPAPSARPAFRDCAATASPASRSREPQRRRRGRRRMRSPELKIMLEAETCLLEARSGRGTLSCDVRRRRVSLCGPGDG